MLAQPPRIRVPYVVDPSLNTRVELGKADRPCSPRIEPLPQSPARLPHFSALHSAVTREDYESQPGNTGSDGLNLRRSAMHVSRSDRSRSSTAFLASQSS